MIYDPYTTTTTMNNANETTKPEHITIPKMRDSISTRTESGERSNDSQSKAHVRRDSGSHSPVEKIKLEEEHSNETISATWNSEQPKCSQRHHQRRPSLLSRLMSDCNVEHESDQDAAPRQACDFCGFRTDEKQKQAKAENSGGGYFLVNRGSW